MRRLAFFATALVAAVLSAVRPSGQQPTFRTGIDVVQLDVVVLDDDRRPVRGLTAADFTVIEAGDERPIVSFSPVSVPPPESDASPWDHIPSDVVTNRMGDGRLVAILLDRMIPLGQAAITARAVAHEIINELGPDDRAAVVHTAPKGRSQNFTVDRELLHAAVDSPAVGTSLSAGSLQSGECWCQVCSLDAITTVADAVRDVGAGPRVLFFIGTGIPIGVADLLPTESGIPGGDVEFSDAEDVDNPWLSVSPTPPEHECYFPRTNATRKMLAAVQRANLVINAVSPTGLEPPSGPPRQLRGVPLGQDIPRWPATLLGLAGATGGRAVLNQNAPEERVPELLAESDAYYLLGFVPAHVPTDGRMQRVVVEVNRPDVQVRSRWGYLAPDVGEDSSPGSEDLPRELAATLPSAPLPLSMSLVPLMPAQDRNVIVAVVLGVDLDDATMAGLADAEGVGVRVMAFDPQGRERSSSNARLEVHDIGTGLRHDVIMPLLVQPGRYEVRASIALPGATPSVYGDVEVPDLARDLFSTSGMLLSVVPGRPNHADERLRAVITGASTTRRTFRPSDRVTAEMFIYGPRSAEAVVTAEVLASTGEPVVSRAVPFLPFRGGRRVRFPLPVEGLSTGEYLLRVRAEAQRDVREHEIRFRVE